jgi:hypothetical protein
MNTTRGTPHSGWKRLGGCLLLLGGMFSASAQFTEVGAGFTGLSFGKVSFADYDNDGDLDVLISGFITNYNTGYTMLYRNDGGGVFTPVATPFVALGYTAAAWGDYDCDGDLDLLIDGELTGGASSTSRVYRNNGGGNFTLVATLGSVMFGSAAWGDLDNDGKLDPFVAGYTTMYVYRNVGNDTFTNISLTLAGGYPTYLSGADFNNDGKLDLLNAAAAAQFQNGAYFYLNNGDGTYSNTLSLAHREFNSMDWGDYDNDGNLDLVMSGGDPATGNFTKIFHNDGNGMFTEMPIPLPGGGYSSVAWGDFDNDGFLDVILAGDGASGPVTQVFHNDGTGNFTNYWITPLQLTQPSVAVGDYDNDGRLDILMMGITNGVKYTKLFHNDTLVTNTPPTAPGNLSAQKNGKSAVLTWSAATDAQQSGGLSYNVRLGTSPGGANVVAPGANLANGWRRLPAIGNAGTRLAFNLTNLSAGTYYWSVQAIDHAFAGSAFATESSFTISTPVITNQPQAVTISAGQTATFTVGASGTDPLAYQWRFNGTNISGATNSSLILSNAQFVNQGWYSVAVSDVVGTNLSASVYLTVGSAPVITTQPQGQTIALGGGASFNVSVIGNTPFAYQWLFNGTLIPDATNATLVLLDVQSTNAGIYSVVVTNLIGSTLSSNALLNVYLPGQGVQTVSASGAVDMVYDGARDIIYITSGSSILRYHVGSNTFLTPFVVGTGLSLWGIDLSFDGNTLVAADHSGGTSIYVVDLPTGMNRQVVLPGSPFGDAGTYSVAFGNDNAALITGDYPGSGPVSLRRYDAVTGTNSSLGTVYMRSLMAASGDGQVVGIIEGTTSAGNLFKYSVAARAITNSIGTGWFCWIAPGVNQDGSQFAYATDGGTFIYSNQTQIATIGNYFADRPVGVVYHPSAALVFFVWGGSSYVRAYDTTTLTETARYNFGTGFSSATGTTAKTSYRTRISRDGSLLMVNVGNAIKYLRWASAPPQISSQPANTSGAMGSNATFTVQAIGTPPFSYQWYFNSAIVTGATNSALTLTNLQPTQGGGYYVIVSNPGGSVTSSIATLTLTGPPAIISQPQGASVSAGSNVTFTVGAVGTATLNYEWRLYGTNIGAPNSSTLALANVQNANAGDYTVVVANSLGSATSAVATLTVTPALPQFTLQPQSQTIAAGENASFTATAIGTDPISYQWQFNGTDLAGRNSTSLSLTDVQAANAGDYSLIASNSVGTNVSAFATLTVNPAVPTITLQPVNVSPPAGAEVYFTVAAKGTEPLAFQWQLNGVDIPGATATTLLVTNIQSTNAGGYSAVITNTAGSVTSSIVSATITAPPGFLWVRRGGGSSTDDGRCAAVDRTGNVYVAGSFSGSASFSETNVTSYGVTDIFIAKYDPAGALLWFRQAGGTGADVPAAIAVDGQENICVSGSFSGVADFGGQSVTSVGNLDGFVARYDGAGALLWVTNVGSTQTDSAEGLAVDTTGNVYAAGYFFGTTVIGTNTFTTSGGADLFVVKFDSNGNVIWARKAGGTLNDQARGVAVDRGGNVFVIGDYLSASPAFGAVTLTNASAGSGDVFLAKYDNAGNLLWVNRAGGISTDLGYGIAVDSTGSVFITGAFAGTAGFGDVTLTSSGSADVFLAKYNGAGALQWAKSEGGYADDCGYKVATDTGGNVYLAGYFQYTANFSGTVFNSRGGYDGFAAMYTTAGTFRWVYPVGGSSTDMGRAVAADDSGGLYFSGYFANTGKFGHLNASSAGGSDFYLAKMAAFNASAAPVFTLQPSNQTAPAGAAVTFNLGFIGIAPATFQWRFNGADLAGATNATLALNPVSGAQAGIYSVVLSNANGAITSAVAVLTVTMEPDFLWALRAGGAANDEILAVAADTNGNSYVAGYFSGTADIGGTNLTSAGGEDIFVAKLDSAQNLVWASQAGGPGDDRANALALDGTGNVMVAGSFNGTADFSGQNRTSGGGSDMFVARYNSTTGNLTWVQSGGGPTNDAALAVAARSNGDIAVAGYFQGSATFGGTVLGSSGSNDMFVAKYNSGGGLSWARRAGGSNNDQARGVAFDSSGNILVAGSFGGIITSGLPSLASGGAVDGFLAKFNASGTALWAQRAGTVSGTAAFNDEVNAVTTDRDGNVFIAGYFQNQALIASNTLVSASTNLPDLFLAKYDSSGNALWSQACGSIAADTANALASDSAGNVFVSGAFSGTAVFGSSIIPNIGGADVFAAMFDATGRMLKVRKAGSPGDDAGLAAAYDGRGNLLLGGSIPADAVFGGTILTNAGARDAFAAKISFFDPDGAPVITSPPCGWTVTFGTNAVLSVGVLSGSPVKYLWLLNGVALSAATNSTLRLTNIQYPALGDYSVVVSNASGAVTSATARVTVELSPEFLWLAKAGGTGDDQARAIAVDGDTNLLVAGTFAGTAAFFGSNYISAGSTDVFLVKLTSSGTNLWTRRAGGTGSDVASGVAVDRDRNVFITGSFASSQATFGSLTLTNSGSGADFYLVKYDGQGNALWASKAVCSGADAGTAVAVDAAGNAYVTGSFYSTANFGGIGLTNTGSTNFFLAKYDPAGTVLWAKTVTGTNISQGSGVAVDMATNVYVTGFLVSNVNFGNGLIIGTNTYFNATIFVAKYDRDGALQWARKAGGTNSLGYGQAIVADAAGNVYATAYKRDYGTSTLLTKYDGAGRVLWYRNGSLSCCTGDAIFAGGLALDPAGNPILTGLGNGSIDYITNYFNTMGYVLKYRSDGAGFGMQPCGTEGLAVAMDPAGNAYLAGRFTYTAYFGATSNLVSSGGNDAFITKWGVRPPTLAGARSNLLVVAGANAAFPLIGVSGTGPLVYQWQFNGTNIAGATNASLSLSNFSFTNAGRYSVIMRNTAGTMTGQVAAAGFIPVLRATLASNGMVLNWDGTFTLQSAINVAGPYADLPSATKPSTNLFVPGEPQRFFRLRVGDPFVAGVLASNQWFGVGVTGSPGRLYAIQVSTNLTDWTTLQTDASPFSWWDSNAVVFPSRFYRALLVP